MKETKDNSNKDDGGREKGRPYQESLVPVMISTKAAFDKAAGMGEASNFLWKIEKAWCAFLPCDKDAGLIAQSFGLQIISQFSDARQHLSPDS